MKLIYPYNEILPKKAAHDVYIFDECAALADIGFDVTLLCGKGGVNDEDLFRHYHVPQDAFHIKGLPILRKNNPLNLSWNYPFFLSSQRTIRRLKPDWVFLSVRKQGAYHLHRKVHGVRYVYEVHELAFYPYMEKCPGDFFLERKLFEQADLITVTTEALKHILLEPPYSINVPVEVIPLAVKNQNLPPPSENADPLIIMYIGQLYEGQGIPGLIAALALVDGVRLKVVGGKENEILELKRLAENLEVACRVEFLGFAPPSELSKIAEESHAFVAPFGLSGRMPYVAHTKLFEYARWGRPIIAPDMPTVQEHFSGDRGVLFYEPENTKALAACIRLLKEKKIRERLQSEIRSYADKYTWETRANCYRYWLQNAG